MSSKIKRINPFTDTGFKLLFGKEGQSEEILRFFLNALFMDNPDFDEIKEVKYINTERIRETIDMKSIIHDVMCTTDNGHRFIVEMQNVNQPFFMNRAFYYVAKGITDQGRLPEDKSYWEYSYQPVIGVFLCNFIVDKLDKEFVVKARTLNEKTMSPIGNQIRMCFLQLPVFTKTKEECETLLEKIIYIMTHLDELDTNPFAAEMAEVYGRIEKVSRYTAMTKEEKAQYDADLKWYLDTNAILQANRREGRLMGIAEGRAEGRAEGIAEGRAEGRAQGMAEGRVEGRVEGRTEANLAVAKKMYSKGYGIEEISDLTGISSEELKEKLHP